MALAAPGLGSNLDVNSIVTQLINVERQPITALDRREAGVQARISAFGVVRGALSAFQDSVRGLSNATRYNANKASSSDTSVATISASPTAGNASYQLTVTALAQSQKLVTTGQDSASAAIGNGTISFDFGAISGGSFDSVTGKYTGAGFSSNGTGIKTVSIDASNNSLQGISDAINRANIGITASVINDGNPSTPYRLVLSVNETGASNSLKISVSGDAALANLLANDPAGTQNLSQTATAQNASFKVDGVTISKASNTISDVISGASINLLKVGSSTFSVARDTESVQSAVQAFVKAYNDVNKVLADISAFDPETGRGALLQGDSAVRTIQNQIRGTLTRTVAGLGGDINLLSQIGVAFQADGSLAINAARLTSAINANFDSIAGLFATVGKPSDSLVQYVSSTDSTKAGSYGVVVSQLATQGSSLGSVDVSGGVSIGGANNTLSLTINNTSATVTLADGNYTASQLATQLQAQINGHATFVNAGISATVQVSGNALRITSSRYGAASNVSVSGGTAQADIFGAGTATAGLNVAGTIGGVAATGDGQNLTGAGDAAGLRLSVTGGATGARGNIEFSRGYAYQLNILTSNFIGAQGLINARSDGLANTVKDITRRRNALNSRLESLEQRLRAQYTALDGLVGRLNSTGNFLTQQLANLSRSNG